MPWYTFSALAMGVSDGTPSLDAAPGSIVSYALQYGVLGVFALAMAGLLFKRWRLISPSEEVRIREESRKEGRADLLAQRERDLAEIARLLALAERLGQQRDEALEVARDQIAPLLSQFTATTGALVPILQEIIREARDYGRRGGTSP